MNSRNFYSFLLSLCTVLILGIQETVAYSTERYEMDLKEIKLIELTGKFINQGKPSSLELTVNSKDIKDIDTSYIFSIEDPFDEGPPTSTDINCDLIREVVVGIYVAHCESKFVRFLTYNRSLEMMEFVEHIKSPELSYDDCHDMVYQKFEKMIFIICR